MGCMRLSTGRDRNESRGIDVLHAAFDRGITFFDTADAYCWDDDEIGHNQRLIAQALRSWSGDRSRIVVATKGGLTRPNGQWVPNGRARHLRAACEASLKALGVERIQLYQLHAPDPRTPLATSVRALASLKDQGLVERIGLCNVTVGQIEEARHITEISAVQVEVSVWHDENLLNGVVAYCIANGIQVIAYRPLGGSRRVPQLRHEPVLNEVAERHGVTPAEIALAWLNTLSATIVSIPGPTRVDTVQSIVHAHSIQLSAEEQGRIARRGAWRGGGSSDPPSPGGPDLSAVVLAKAEGPPLRTPAIDGEVVLIMGLPGAGKSTVAHDFVTRGYARLNRDEAGGSLRGLLPGLQGLVADGHAQIVLDNTYMSRASRARVVQAATPLGLPVRCIWLSTSVEDAQVNAVSRIIANHGRLLTPEEMKQAVKKDISAFAPNVQFRHQRELEPPDAAEGFASIETMAFTRTRDASMTDRALIVWCDEALAERGAILRRYRDEGWLLLGLAWRPEIADRKLTTKQVDAEFARLQEQVGVSIEVLYCPHAAGPPKCWCRKPLPGLGVVLIERHRLDPARCIYVGSGPQDPGFARRLGFQYRDAGEFFASDPVLIG
jgi:aryl-alcohol dehydrogenase-like predicted oxidoreductase